MDTQGRAWFTVAVLVVTLIYLAVCYIGSCANFLLLLLMMLKN